MTAIDRTPLDGLLDAAEALIAEASEGPWETGGDGLVWAPRIGDPVSASTELPDAEFIAAARSIVPALVAEVRRLRATPPAVELSDRQLLAAVHRFARTHGWRNSWRGWINDTTERAATVAVCWDDDVVLIWRKAAGAGTERWPMWATPYPVASVTQAVDLLAALGVLPAELSSAWRAGRAAR